MHLSDSDSFSDSDGDMEKHYTHMEIKRHKHLAPLPVYHDLPPNRPPMNITAEKIIADENDSYMRRILTNFSIEEFSEIYEVIAPIISKVTHKDAVLTPKTAFLLTLCHLKHGEDWRKISVNFDISYSYAFEKVKDIINKCSSVLSNHFIKWISVSQRIQQYHLRYRDWPGLLGSVDATVQEISRPKADQELYYSGKHKRHVIKVQAFVSPVGLLIHYTKAVPGAMHDFKLFNDSKLIDEIMKENPKVQESLGCDATVLGDAGYQGMANLIPGALTPKKKPRGSELDEDEKEFNKKISQRRIIVENWFGRLKTLWAKMSQSFHSKKEPNFQNVYDHYREFCAALTNYHISRHPLRDLESGVNFSSSSDDDFE